MWVSVGGSSIVHITKTTLVKVNNALFADNFWVSALWFSESLRFFRLSKHWLRGHADLFFRYFHCCYCSCYCCCCCLGLGHFRTSQTLLQQIKSVEREKVFYMHYYNSTILIFVQFFSKSTEFDRDTNFFAKSTNHLHLDREPVSRGETTRFSEVSRLGSPGKWDNFSSYK